MLVEDVTEQRIMEAQLIQNDKMASIGQLVSGVAHELNNPLTSIAGLTELLLERELHPDFPREHLRVIHDQAERAGRIVRNLLTFARKGVPEKAPVDLNDVAARTALLIVYELQLHGIELEQALSPEPVVVLGDRYELQQVLLNLITNAVQAVSGLPPGPAAARSAIATAARGRPGGAPRARHRSRRASAARLVPVHAVLHHQGPRPGHRAGAVAELRPGQVPRRRAELRAAAEGGAEFRVVLPFHDAPAAAGGAGAGAAPRGSAARPGGGRRSWRAPAGERAAVAGGDRRWRRCGRASRGCGWRRERAYDLIIADARATAGPSELFVHALVAASPARWTGWW